MFYLESLRTCWHRHRDFFRLNAQAILSDYFNAEKDFDCNIALFLSFLVRLLNKNSPYLERTALKICIHSEITIQYIKSRSLEIIFSDILLLGRLIANVRERKSKMLAFIQYWKGKASFSGFIRHLGLKRIKKLAIYDLHHKKMLIKLMALYTNISS